MQSVAPSPSLAIQRWLWAAALGSMLLRLWIADSLPITGDEAFFYWWGVYLDWGYYDHPPMVGWLIALMRLVLGDAIWSIRLPVVFLPVAIGLFLWWALRPAHPEKAPWVLLLIWLAPINWYNTLITTDTPLIFWSIASMAILIRAEQQKSTDVRTLILYAMSGLTLGCAFLSKYFSVVLGLAYFAYFVLFQRQRLHFFAVLVICALPGPLINLWWNMEHGWANIMFNAINRNQDAFFAWHKPLSYLGLLVYLLSPTVLWLGIKHRSLLVNSARQQPLLAVLLAVPLIFFALLSFKKVVGLHWVLAFYPVAFAILGIALPVHVLKRCAQGLALFTALHVAVIAGVAMTTLEQWEGKPRYYSLVRAFKTTELLNQAVSTDTVLMADGYAPAAVFGYALGRYVPVFGQGKFHARQDDLLVDFSIYQGQTIRILVSDSDPPDLDRFRPYFESVNPLSFKQSGVTFHGVEGRNFNFNAYRQGVLAGIYQQYYNIPDWLPMTGCPFCLRYCGHIRCPR